MVGSGQTFTLSQLKIGPRDKKRLREEKWKGEGYCANEFPSPRGLTFRTSLALSAALFSARDSSRPDVDLEEGVISSGWAEALASVQHLQNVKQFAEAFEIQTEIDKVRRRR